MQYKVQNTNRDIKPDHKTVLCLIVFITTVLSLKYYVCTGDAGVPTVVSDIVVIILATVDVPININDT